MSKKNTAKKNAKNPSILGGLLKVGALMIG